MDVGTIPHAQRHKLLGAKLVQATNGDFYGTINAGGANNYGTVFRITPSSKLTTLYSFCSQSGCADGMYPHAALIQATDGNLYGTTYGLNSGTRTTGEYGTIFKITPSGTLTTLYSFCSQTNYADGQNPQAGIVQDTNGTFYGTTQSGTIFSLSVGLDPFVEPQPTSGKTGAAVKILGADLTGATNITFNGTAAVFKVVSSSEITTTVPAGATTGTVQVVTRGGTFSSNVPFQVK